MDAGIAEQSGVERATTSIVMGEDPSLEKWQELDDKVCNTAPRNVTQILTCSSRLDPVDWLLAMPKGLSHNEHSMAVIPVSL